MRGWEIKRIGAVNYLTHDCDHDDHKYYCFTNEHDKWECAGCGTQPFYGIQDAADLANCWKFDPIPWKDR